MKRVTVMYVLVLPALVVLSSCMPTRQHLLDTGPAGGRRQEIRVSADTAFDLAVQTCADRGFTVVNIDEITRTVRASAKSGFSLSGYMRAGVFDAAAHEHVAIFVKPLGADLCEVTVVSLDDDNKPTTRDWPGKILGDLKYAVSRSGDGP